MNERELMTTREAAAMMSLSDATLIARRRDRAGVKRLPFVRLGRRILYRRVDVNAAIQQSVVSS
jgi:excisionase family DNA binding protein